MNAWLLAVALTIPAGYSSAPVYSQVADRVMKRTGTFIYRPGEKGYTVLFCVEQESPKLLCAVTTPLDMMVVIDAEATEQGS